MALRLSLLYRGPVTSCDFDCSYCPFAHAADPSEVIAADRIGVERVVSWAENHPEAELGIFFTPRGEALLHAHYRDAIVRLSRCTSVRRVVVQTNLSVDLEWLGLAHGPRVALWCSYHPDAISRERFLHQRVVLAGLGIRHSVGMVGLREHLDEIEVMRRALPESVYLWVNAYRRGTGYTTPLERARIEAVDPLFRYSMERQPSLGRACATGEGVVSVDHLGAVRRCHFVDALIGNLEDPDLVQRLVPRPCPNEQCRCHIGYVHLNSLRLGEAFGDGVLERVPVAATAAVFSGSGNRAKALGAE